MELRRDLEPTNQDLSKALFTPSRVVQHLPDEWTLEQAQYPQDKLPLKTLVLDYVKAQPRYTALLGLLTQIDKGNSIKVVDFLKAVSFTPYTLEWSKDFFDKPENALPDEVAGYLSSLWEFYQDRRASYRASVIRGQALFVVAVVVTAITLSPAGSALLASPRVAGAAGFLKTHYTDDLLLWLEDQTTNDPRLESLIITLSDTSEELVIEDDEINETMKGLYGQGSLA